jgi:hypothetical protein
LKLLKSIDEKKFNELVLINHQYREVDNFLFHAQYLFCEHMELRHHRYKFNTLKELGEKILSFGPDVDIYLKDFLKYRFLSFYMEKQGMDKSSPNKYQKILELEARFPEDENRTYFLLGFFLSETKTMIYQKRKYDDLNKFFSDMISRYNIIDYTSKLSTTQYVYAWLEVKGYKDEVTAYCELIDTIEKLESLGAK